MSSVERLNDFGGQCKMVQSMNTPRFNFAEVPWQEYANAMSGYW